MWDTTYAHGPTLSTALVLAQLSRRIVGRWLGRPYPLVHNDESRSVPSLVTGERLLSQANFPEAGDAGAFT